MDGGITPGAHRATGITAGGKTSFTLDLMHHFLQNGDGYRGLYVKAEGRLSKEVKERSGVTFVTDSEKWVDGTCFVFESNVYEAVFGLMGELIRNNPQNTRYFFILDSLDMMAKRDDLAKPLEQAGQVAGGSLLTSVFLKKTSAALAKRGHICWFISQVRESIKLNPYEKTPPRQGGASGGHAVEHAGDWVLEFLPRFNDDIIREGGEKSGKVIGHYCRAKIVKSNNEKYGTEIRYPIKYNRKNASSVWVEREIVDLMMGWEMVQRTGGWFRFTEEIRAEILEKTGVEVPEKIQGVDNLYKLLEDDKTLSSYLFGKFLKLVTDKT
jgi:RecA/RadA recombinase